MGTLHAYEYVSSRYVLGDMIDIVRYASGEAPTLRIYLSIAVRDSKAGHASCEIGVF